MDTVTLVEAPQSVEEVKNTDSGCRTETVKLVEMGSVSVETKGYTRGLELGFTPRGS
jgi:hypothetical protein